MLVLKDLENPIRNLNITGRFDYDTFLFISRSEESLRRYFETSQSLKIKNKYGIVIPASSDTSDADFTFLEEPICFMNGRMESKQFLTGFRNQNSIHLNCHTLQVAANTLSPYILINSNGEIRGGSNYQVLVYAAKNYNFTLHWDIGKTRGNGRLLPDGTADGMLGEVLSERFDIAFIARLAMGQVGVIDLTELNSIDTLVFLTRVPESKLDWTAITDIFTWEAWILIFACFFGIIPIYYAALKLHEPYSNNVVQKSMKFSYDANQSNDNQDDTLYLSFIIPFGIMFSQSIVKIPSSAYIITAFWLLFILNINTCYNCNLSSVLTSINTLKVPNTFTELADRKDYNVTFNYLNNGSCDCFHFFNQSVNPTIISVRERFMKNLEPDTGQCILNSILLQKTVCIGWASVTAIGIARNATLYKGLKLVQVSQGVHSSLNSIGFQRHSIYTQSFSKIISGFRDMGLVTRFRIDVEEEEMIAGEKWIQTHKNSPIHKILAKMEEDRRVQVRPFEIMNFILSFLLWTTGILISCISFCLRRITSVKRNTSDNVIIIF